MKTTEALEVLPPVSATAEDMNALHEKICRSGASFLEDAIRLGEMLTRQKKALGHGNFLPWIKSNLAFSEATAKRYMAIFRRKDQIAHDERFALNRLLGSGSLVSKFTANAENYTPTEYIKLVRAAVVDRPLPPAAPPAARPPPALTGCPGRVKRVRVAA